ncbi:hypothetical protein A9Q81_17330 [Gammaproteobacteria bacterium 42_54_T18]|nr:hypothetical protein A9Q81_17330 [Gammaproteobacteria bacterium 42_54_T18]
MPILNRQFFWLPYRYLLISSKDAVTLGVMLGQAAFIGWLCATMWQRIQGEGLTLILVMSVIWLGLIGSCREIVKERNIFERERLRGIRNDAYLLSKFIVLAFWSLIQVLLLLTMIELKFSLPGAFVIQAFSLWLISLSGIALGLLISASAHRQDIAVIAVPLILIPQLLFSSKILPADAHTGFIERVKLFMPTYWGERMFNHSLAVPLQLSESLIPFIAISCLILFFLIFTFTLLAFIKRRIR